MGSSEKGYDKIMPNDVKLQEGHPVDKNLRPLKVGDNATALETAQNGDGARVVGDLRFTGNLVGYTNSLRTDNIRSEDLTITDAGTINIDSEDGHIKLKDAGTECVRITADGTDTVLFLFEAGGATLNDFFSIECKANGETNFYTVDTGGEEADLILFIDGFVDINSASGEDITLDSGGDIILDADGDNITMKSGSLGDGLDFAQHHTGDWDIINLTQDQSITFKVNDGGSEKGVIAIDGAEPYVLFPNSSAGFTRKEATFSTTAIVGSGGTDDTDIDFRTGNKFRLEMTGDITTVNLVFPSVSGNFLLVCTTNGDHDVTNWKVWESDESAATTTDVMWAGGSVPAFTNNGIDIVSFYWDASEQQAYGVASLAFATP